ncbi:protein kinase [Ascosphaera apis ARSEF 7405]|uniref:Protein kinase n=1 Tax=Ascosphaera apis ARSEF 7405 TaxID=392613 RepID=A0A168D1K0_9EURO|nr:protein kinase [Ascosphaera apis ARSEF 7405]
MDFLKSAVASAIAKSSSLPFILEGQVDVEDSLWTLNNATRKSDNTACSVFSFDIAANNSRAPLAKNAVRKLRTLRHPGVVKILDTVETESHIHVMTERVQPLGWAVKRKSLSTETIIWGLHAVATTVKFINEDAASIHGAIRMSSVYTSESGEWRLWGFEVLSSVKDDESTIYTYGSLIPNYSTYAPPEVLKTGPDAIKGGPLTAVDSFGFGVLVFQVFNGGAFRGPSDVGKSSHIPSNIQPSYKRLMNASPKLRLSVSHFLDQGKRLGGFFDSTIIKLTEDIDKLGLKSEEERDEFISTLDELSDGFPEDFFKIKVLPQLLHSVEYGGGGPKVFGAIVKIGSKLSEEEYHSKVTPVVVRLFGNPDRAMRVSLLEHLPLMIDFLPKKIVNDKIFPQMVRILSIIG